MNYTLIHPTKHPLQITMKRRRINPPQLLLFLSCLSFTHTTYTTAEEYEAVFEILTTSPTSISSAFSKNNSYTTSSLLLSSALGLPSIITGFTMIDPASSINSSSLDNNSIVVSAVVEVCNGPNMFLLKNTSINECRNCSQCKSKESLIQSCTTSSDTLCANVCPLGSVSKVVIAGESEQCTLCPVGKYASYSSSSCQFCLAGYYSNRVGQSSCTKCAQGTTTSSKSGFDICHPVSPPTLFKRV
jgi:hypothetical protein